LLRKQRKTLRGYFFAAPCKCDSFSRPNHIHTVDYAQYDETTEKMAQPVGRHYDIGYRVVCASA